MIIKLAGYNIDKSLIDLLPDQTKATPEILSAAYARISRSSKSVSDLRKEAIEEIVKTRKSNEKIIYEMGHSSVAEHAVFNFDIIGISRYLAEFVQMSRLASFTEKSQRYVTSEGSFVVPKELDGHPLRDKYVDYMKKMIDLYFHMYQQALGLPEVQEIESKREREGRAKEDARYFLPLATETQMGMTINARNLERLLRRLDALDLLEAHDLKNALQSEIEGIAPSLIKYTISDEFDRQTIFKESKIHPTDIQKTRLVEHQHDIDVKILAHMLFIEKGGTVRGWMDVFEELDQAFQQRFYDRLFSEMKSYHTVPRAFEFANFTFETVMSAACFAQFKRHRMATIQRAPYQINNGLIIPPIFQDIFSSDKLRTLQNAITEIYKGVSKIGNGIASYALLNSQKVQVIYQMNLREIYHFVRLRSDSHAQWEIRELSNKMIALVQDKCPMASAKLMGKDEFDKMNQ
ncbi:MAG TPA: FAD-dependent thymidylate synthase [Candidatus Cloacimonadota bacterium]|nr:FAD-dependent thymidylate synthase [Candidatus Cloacimonadota bacterium]